MAKKKNPNHRPTDYEGEKTINKVREYIDSCEDEEKQLVRQSNSEKGYEMYENKLVVNLPTIEGLAVYLKVCRDTIYEWERNHTAFSYILGELRAKQARELIRKGLSGEYNSTIAKVLLTKHGYRDESNVDLTSKGESLNKESKEKGDQVINNFINGNSTGNNKER